MTTPLTGIGLEFLSKKEQEELILKMGEYLLRSTLLRIIERMDKTARTEFAVLLADQASPEAIEAFLKARVEGIDTIAEEATASLASDLQTAKVYS